MVFASVNPATGKELVRYEELTADGASRVLDTAARAAELWSRLSIGERAAPLLRAAALLRERKARYARLMAEEMGKPVREGQAEVEKCAWACEFFAEHAPAMLASEVVATSSAKSYVAFEPLGVVLAIMPWNFPFWQVVRFGVPALLAGNTIVVKHAPNVPGCALALEGLFREAGVPRGVLANAFVGVAQVSALIDDPRVQAVTLTGSTRAGRDVAARAGAALKKCVLELGGSDAYVILEDADLESAATICAASRLVNCGQSCVSAKRFVVVDAVRAEFEQRLVERLRAVRPGDPLDPETMIGPLARADLRANLHRQVHESVARGARCLLGGELPAGPGCFYPPTVLTDVAPGMPAYHEELFGPAAALLPARDEADALRRANDTPYGLGAAVFTRDAERGERLAAHELRAGCCFVNDAVKSDPRLPFGGIKDSGWGRELGTFGIREFVNVKTVCVA